MNPYRVPEEIKTKAVAMYKAGVTVREISAKLKVGMCAATRWSREAGVTPRRTFVKHHAGHDAGGSGGEDMRYASMSYRVAWPNVGMQRAFERISGMSL